MKGLLQSKIFKKNLKKWLFMYVMCMGLFTTVITYSKYISNMIDQSDSARVSKFNVALKYCKDKNCNEEGIGTFDTRKYRPTGEITYYFTIDTSNLEVNIQLFLTISTDRHFNIKEIKKTVDGIEVPVNSISKSNNSKLDSIIDEIKVGSKEKIIYEVTVIYDNTVIDYNKAGCTSLTNGCEIVNGVIKDSETGLLQYIFDESNVYDILTVGYSAEQTR